MESFRILQNNCSKSAFFEEFSSQKKHTSIQDLLRNHSLGLNEEKVENLLEKLMDYDKLEEFLNIIVNQVDTSMTTELLKITEKIIEKYDAIKIEEPTESEILKLASQVSD